jgi:hypothetical protein
VPPKIKVTRSFPGRDLGSRSIQLGEHVDDRERADERVVVPMFPLHLIHVIIAAVRQSRRRANRQTAGSFQAGSPGTVERRRPLANGHAGVIERQRLSFYTT